MVRHSDVPVVLFHRAQFMKSGGRCPPDPLGFFALSLLPARLEKTQAGCCTACLLRTCQSQAFRRRSGCIPAEPYPPLKQHHVIKPPSISNRSTSLFSFCSHVSPFAISSCPLLLGTPVSFCSHRNSDSQGSSPTTHNSVMRQLTDCLINSSIH